MDRQAPNFLIALVMSAFLAGCAKTSVVPLAANEIRVAVDADSECGAGGAQRIALDRAAVEVLKRGFDRFVVLSADGKSTASAAFGGSGFFSIASKLHDAFRIRMFRNGDTGAEQAIDARKHLGDDWRDRIKSDVSTTTC